MSALRITGINHVVLHVSDLERSVEFYMGVLGFENRNQVATSAMRAAFLRCGTQGVDLFEIDGDPHGGEEMNHMALCVEASNLDDIIAALSSAGVEASEPTRRNTVFIKDPDGHQIEMLPLTASERALELQTARASA